MMQRLWDYCDWVENNPSQTCDDVKLAVKRFREDYKKSLEPDSEFVFDEAEAIKAIKFTESMKQYKDVYAGKNLVLEPWQVFIFANVYGWKVRATGRRRFRKAFIFVARKNGKSTMLSSVLIYDSLRTMGAECYVASTKREQSRIVFDSVVQMIRQNPSLTKRFQVYNSTSTIVCFSRASKITALSSDSKRFDGLNPSCVVFDEVSAMPDYSTIQILQSGTGSRPEPLLFEITSGSDNLNSAGHQEFERSERILRGQIEDDSFFCMLFTLDKGDSWLDRSKWIKANPNLDVSVRRDTLEKLCVEAEQNAGLEAEFRIKNLCQFLSPVTVWIPYQKWKICEENARKYPFPDPKECLIVASLDLSTRIDFTSYVLYFYHPATKKFYAKHRFYIPEEQIQDKCKHDSPMVRKWIEEGYITATPGGVIDYNFLFKDIHEDSERYEIAQFNYDQWNASAFEAEFKNDPRVMAHPIVQSMKNISPMAKEWEASIINGDIVDDNPVMKWMVSNCDIYTDANGNIKPEKHGFGSGGAKRATSTHIDGVITSLMSLATIRQMIADGRCDLRSAEEIFEEESRKVASLAY